MGLTPLQWWVGTMEKVVRIRLGRKRAIISEIPRVKRLQRRRT